ncbi:ankyrin repeat domain-containing protein [Clostridium botulinum]|nr:ankyrin repeat domain-containing protein [Clostridium botulinum]
MKKLFIAIRQGDINTVKILLEKKPELISCTAKQPPKKDHGQSPLQVAIKSGNFEIAEYFLDCGADVNFMEKESCY